MISLTKLKDDARRHELREEWEKAIEVYLRVLRAASDGETDVELPLYNRIGDLYVRLGRPSEAVLYYEQAADRYAEAGLFNNAIALCNKALRYLPNQVELFRKLGQYCAAQGFGTDARRWFLEYAERMFRDGEVSVAFEALEDFASLSDEPETRELLAHRLHAHGRKDEALIEYRRALAMRLRLGDDAGVDTLRAHVLELYPDLEVFEVGDLEESESTSASGQHGHALPGLAEPAAQESAASGHSPRAPADKPPADGAPIEGLQPTRQADAESAFEAIVDQPVEELHGLEATSLAGPAAVRPRPADSFTPDTGDDPAIETGRPGPHASDFDDEDDELEADATPLPLLDAPASGERRAADDLFGVSTFEVQPPSGEMAAAESSPDRPGNVPGEAPPPGQDAYIDLLALINPEEERVLKTRFFVEETEPTGDEDRDFAELLKQFKSKLAEHVAEDDAGSHYDLGIAFKEMGLVDEAINEFQVSMRAGDDRLKILEELGQCFTMKRQPSIAVKLLTRAMQLNHSDDIELIGVYYHLGRAYEDLGQVAEARDAYERVVGLDINFLDVSARIARL